MYIIYIYNVPRCVDPIRGIRMGYSYSTYILYMYMYMYMYIIYIYYNVYRYRYSATCMSHIYI